MNHDPSAIMSHTFHKLWLKITAIVLGAFGPAFFFGTMVSTMKPARLSLDVVSCPTNGVPTCESPDHGSHCQQRPGPGRVA